MEQSKPTKNNHPIDRIEAQPGDNIAICRCWAATNMPYCDGSHKSIPGRGPAIINIVRQPK